MKKAFSLIELLVCLAIIALIIIAVVGNPKPQVVVMDGCEYLQTYNGDGGYNYTHKGNCTNIIHQYNKSTN